MEKRSAHERYVVIYMNILLYIASPYQHKYKRIVEERYIDVSRATAKIINTFPHIIPFSPIVYTHPLIDFIEAGVDWYTFDLELLYRCDAVLVLKLDGWKDSFGVKLEIKEAHETDIPVIYAKKDDVVGVLKEEISGTLGEI